MSKEIVFSHSAARGCWVSEEITQASMAYIQVTRKEPGFLRVYTYAEGQRPVLVHVTQQANTAFCTGALPQEVRLLVESETEVVSAVMCQGAGGANGVTLAACKISGTGTDAIQAELYDFTLGSPSSYEVSSDGDIVAADPYFLLFTAEEYEKFEGLRASEGGQENVFGKDDLKREGIVAEVNDETAGDLLEFGIDIAGYDYLFSFYSLFGFVQQDISVTFLYDGEEYLYDSTNFIINQQSDTASVSTQEAGGPLGRITLGNDAAQALLCRLSGKRKEVTA